MKTHWVDVRDALGGARIFGLPSLRARMLTTLGVGALIGLAAGMAVAMLIAPQSGAQLREKLTGKVKQLKGRAIETKEELRERIERANAAYRSHEPESFSKNVPVG